MIAFIRARFPATPVMAGWSDTVANNFMDPSVAFSLAHYFKVSTFQQFDMPSYFLFPEVVVDDPRKKNT